MLAGLLVLVGILVAAAVLSPPPRDVAADEVDLPSAPAGRPAQPTASERAGAPISRPQCLVDGVEVHCVTWSFAETAGSWPQIVRDGDHLVIATSRRMTTLDLTTGDVRWTRDIDPGRRFDWFVAGSSGVVTVVEDDGLVALDLATGDTRWEAEDAVPYYMSTWGGEPIVFTAVASTIAGGAGGMGHDIVARSFPDGIELWRFSVPDAYVDWIARLGHDALLVATTDARLAMLDAPSGHLRWSQTLSGNVIGASLAHVFVLEPAQGEEDPVLTALARIDGSSAWQTEVAGSAHHPPVMVVDDLAIVLGSRGEVEAWHLRDGTAAWTVELGGDGEPSLAWVEPGAGQWWPVPPSSDVIVVLNSHVAVTGLDRRTGQLLWRRDDLRPEWGVIVGTRLHLWAEGRLDVLDVATGRAHASIEIPGHAWPVDFDPLILVSAGRVFRIDLPGLR